MSKLQPLLSRKMWVTVAGIIVAILIQKYPDHQSTINDIAGMISVYVFGQSLVDMKGK